jgi:hypothetical protein
MSAAAIAVPPAQSTPRDAPPVPLYTRPMVGAIEAARDRRRQERNPAVPRYTSARTPLRVVSAAPEELDRWDDEGEHPPSDVSPATIVARPARAS